MVNLLVQGIEFCMFNGTGKVLVDGKPAAKAGTTVKATSKIDIIAEVPKYVCR